MKRFHKVYLEISNVCNLRCQFCPGTRRKKHFMTESEFSELLPKLQPWTDFLYFHLMGEPLCHPNLDKYLQIAGTQGFKVILTTNGTLLHKQQSVLLSSVALHKVNISLHSFEANDLSISFEDYLKQCCNFGKVAEGKKLVVFRLWNHGGAEQYNAGILKTLEYFFPKPWVEERRGIRIGNRVYLEYGDKFDWPDLSAPEGSNHLFCYGLRDQLGILCDGTVVPCCLDHEGDLAIGNAFTDEMEDILSCERAQNIYNGFSSRQACEPLCRRCGYARRFG